MTTHTITPDLIAGLSYYSLVQLANHLGITNPKDVADRITGSITLDDLGNLTHTDAFLNTY